MLQQKPLKAIMHQRVGWYVLGSWLPGNYGVALDKDDLQCIGRVVREVKKMVCSD